MRIILLRYLLLLASLGGLLLLIRVIVRRPAPALTQEVRTEAILESDDVVAAPSPSLHGSSRFEDARGSYERRCFGEALDTCINVLFTVKGHMRSGDLHRYRQVNHIITGAVKLTQRVGDRDVESWHRPLDTLVLPPYTPHLYHFLEDTLMTEYWIDAKGDPAPFKAWFYRPYRDVISNRSLVRLPESVTDSPATSHPHDRSEG